MDLKEICEIQNKLKYQSKTIVDINQKNFEGTIDLLALKIENHNKNAKLLIILGIASLIFNFPLALGLSISLLVLNFAVNKIEMEKAMKKLVNARTINNEIKEDIDSQIDSIENLKEFYRGHDLSKSELNKILATLPNTLPNCDYSTIQETILKKTKEEFLAKNKEKTLKKYSLELSEKIALIIADIGNQNNENYPSISFLKEIFMNYNNNYETLTEKDLLYYINYFEEFITIYDDAFKEVNELKKELRK